MDTISLAVQTRDKSKKAKDLLNENIIPMEYYGREIENKTLQCDYNTFVKVYRKAGENTILELDVDGKEKINVLVYEVQYHPVTDRIVHVDFINVKMGEALTTKIPLEFTGIAPAVKESGGTLMTHLNEVEVRCLPKDLIHSIEVNIDSLAEFNVAIHVKDLKVPETITVLNDPEEGVIVVLPPTKEEEPEPVPAESEEGEGEGVEGEDGEKKEGEGGGDEKKE